MSFYRKKKESRKLKSGKSGLEDLQPFDGSSMVLGGEGPIRGMLPCMEFEFLRIPRILQLTRERGRAIRKMQRTSSRR